MTEDAVAGNPGGNGANDTVLSQDSEYDDFLGVPDSFDIAIDENGDAISVAVDRDHFDCADSRKSIEGTLGCR